jgi:hypothetical protein
MKQPPGDRAVQDLIDAGVFQQWTEANGMKMCAYFSRSVGAQETQQDGCDAKKVSFFVRTRLCLVQGGGSFITSFICSSFIQGRGVF